MINDYTQPHIKHLYAHKNINQFKDDLDFLMEKYSPISLFDLLNFIKTNNMLPEKVFLLTFDDGFREMHDIVAPILLEKGISATFFINSAFIDNKTLCYLHKASILVEHLQKIRSRTLKDIIKQMLYKYGIQNIDIRSCILSIKYEQKDVLDEIAHLINVDFDDYLLKNKPYLTSDQIKGLIDDGFTIGAHSIDHPFYSSLSIEDQLYQTIESIKHLRERFSLSYSAFAFPFSDNNVSKKFFEKLYENGLVDVTFGKDEMINDSFLNNLQRFSMEIPFMPAKKIIALQYAIQFKRLLIGSEKKIKKIIS